MATRQMQLARQSRAAEAMFSAAAGAAEEAERARTSAEHQLAGLQLAFAEIYRELYETAQMQRQLSGPRALLHGDFEIAAEIFPVRHLSGDFFNVSDLGASALLAIGDIGGKGLRAAMWFTQVIGLTRMYGTSIADPAAAMAEVNRQMSLVAPQAPLTSMFLARLDWLSGEITYCNAGHPPPALLRKNGEVEFLNAGGLVLGVLEDAPFVGGRIKIEPDDTLLGFTDGLLECCNERDEQFGVERVIAEARKAIDGRTTTASMLFSIIGAAQDFADTLSRTDDCSILIVRRD